MTDAWAKAAANANLLITWAKYAIKRHMALEYHHIDGPPPWQRAMIERIVGENVAAFCATYRLGGDAACVALYLRLRDVPQREPQKLRRTRAARQGPLSSAPSTGS
jgi:hypothetical protein